MALYHQDFLHFEHLYDGRILTVDGFEFPVHRVLLCMRSVYFRNFLCQTSAESRDITVPGIAGSTLKNILNYIYTGDINLEENNVRDVIVAAYCLGIDALLLISKAFAIKNLTIKNCISLFLAAYKIKELGFSKASIRIIIVNFQNIAGDKNSGLEDLPVKSFKKLLSLDNLNVSSENQVWEAIILWVGKIPLARKVHLENLIRHVRFHGQGRDFLSAIISHPLIQESECCVKLLKNIANDSASFKPRQPKMLHLITKLFINHLDYDEGVKIFISFDEHIDVWRNLGSRMINPDIVLHVFGSIFVMFETMRNIIHTYDAVSKTWSNLPTPVIPRIRYNVVKMGHFIYVLGGSSLEDNANETVTAAERYNFESESWEILSSHYDLYETEAVAINNNIYIIGTATGYFNDFLAAQVYYPDTDTWKSICPPDVYRSQFALVVYKSQLFVLGGHDINGFNVLSVEKYNASEKNWIRFTDLPFLYHSPKGIVINDILYVYDNRWEDVDRCPPVFLDEASENWKVVEPSSPFCNLYEYQFCAVEDSDVIMEMQKENRDARTSWSKSPFFNYINTSDNAD